MFISIAIQLVKYLPTLRLHMWLSQIDILSHTENENRARPARVEPEHASAPMSDGAQRKQKP